MYLCVCVCTFPSTQYNVLKVLCCHSFKNVSYPIMFSYVFYTRNFCIQKICFFLEQVLYNMRFMETYARSVERYPSNTRAHHINICLVFRRREQGFCMMSTGLVHYEKSKRLNMFFSSSMLLEHKIYVRGGGSHRRLSCLFLTGSSPDIFLRCNINQTLKRL